MQKAFIAIALALTLTCVFGNYAATNWVKPPVKILEDTDSNFTTAANLGLGGMTTSDVNVIASNVTVTDQKFSSAAWKAWVKAITTKDLSSSSNTSYAFTASVGAIQFGYAIGFGFENDTNSVPQLYMYQTKLSDGTVLPKVVLTTNTNKTYQPQQVGEGAGAVAKWKTLVYFYWTDYTQTKVNYSSVTLGGSTMGKEYTLSSAMNSSDSVNCDWGEALSSSQVFCYYSEKLAYKVATIDFSSGTPTGVNAVGGIYDSNFKCGPYVTDTKYFGLLCRNITGTAPNNTLTLYVSSNTTNTLVQLGNSTYNATKQAFRNMKQYGPYLAIFYSDPSAVGTDGNAAISYDIWDVYANTQFKAKTDILTTTANSTFDYYTIPQGGMYGLLYTSNSSGNIFSVQVGQIMGASYLTTVFGALMTIVAGLFLF